MEIRIEEKDYKIVLFKDLDKGATFMMSLGATVYIKVAMSESLECNTLSGDYRATQHYNVVNLANGNVYNLDPGRVVKPMNCVLYATRV